MRCVSIFFALIAPLQGLVLHQANTTQSAALQRVNGTKNSGNSTKASKSSQGVTFPAWYNAHEVGPGIWKWSNSLDSYQRHFGPLAGMPLQIAEVGVQSGGSLLMWKGVLGAQCIVHGIDINPACQAFADATTSITIGDQGDPVMWDSFFTAVPALDIFVDDGSHQAEHMSLTLHKVFPHMNPGGWLAIEDIHGRHYVQSFFWPAAQSIGHWHAQGLVASLHLYAFEIIVHKSGGTVGPVGNEFLPATPSATVDSFPALWPMLTAYPGGTIWVQNPAWGSFLAEPALRSIFQEFAPLHDYSMISHPPGCHATAASVCTAGIVPSQSQAQILGVHIFDSMFVVEVAPAPPTIAAVRRGTEWLAYGL